MRTVKNYKPLQNNATEKCNENGMNHVIRYKSRPLYTKKNPYKYGF